MTKGPLAVINKRPGPDSKSSLVLLWLRKNKGNLVCYTVYAAAYAAFSSASNPHVYDSYPDSHTYLPISFLGHAVRLWTIPLLYFFGGTSAGRVGLQIVIGVACWIALAVQVGRVLQVRIIRLVAQALILLISLCAPVLQWNRIILSESLSISLAVLLLATSLALARRMDIRALSAFWWWPYSGRSHDKYRRFSSSSSLYRLFSLLGDDPKFGVSLLSGAGYGCDWRLGTVTALQTSSVSPRGDRSDEPLGSSVGRHHPVPSYQRSRRNSLPP